MDDADVELLRRFKPRRQKGLCSYEDNGGAVFWLRRVGFLGEREWELRRIADQQLVIRRRLLRGVQC